jgi:hypothetical protein
MPEWSGKPEDFCEDMDKTPGVGPGHCGCMESRPGGLMSAGSAGIFVYEVQKKLLDVYVKMAGPDADYVAWNAFEEEIRACVVHFWWEKPRHNWVSKKVKDDAALSLIAEDVRPRLERAAGMDELKKLYSAAVQEAFVDLLVYVQEWHGGDKVRKLIDDLRRVLDAYDV